MAAHLGPLWVLCLVNDLYAEPTSPVTNPWTDTGHEQWMGLCWNHVGVPFAALA